MKPVEPGVATLHEAEIARRALKLLAERKLIPTPETFADAFFESSGSQARTGDVVGVLKEVWADMARQGRLTAQEAAQMVQAAQRRQWSAVRDGMGRALGRRCGALGESWPGTLVEVLKQVDAQHANWTRARKLDAVARVVELAAGDPSLAMDRLRRLVESWGKTLAQVPPGVAAAEPASPDAAQNSVAAASAAPDAAQHSAPAASAPPDAAQHSAAAASATPVAVPPTGAAASAAPDRVRRPDALPSAPSDAAERDRVEAHNVCAGLQGLLAVLCNNLAQLVPDEPWLQSQVELVRGLLGQELGSAQLVAAQRRLTELGAQQVQARRGLQEAKVALTEMLATLLERVTSMGSSAERFNDQVGAYQEQLSQLQHEPNLVTLSRIVQGLLGETQTVRDHIDLSRRELAEARKKVEVYEARVSQLEHQLNEVSTLVQKDPLTNALNRRGLEQAYRIESARAQRYGSNLALAMLDLDNFKLINDRLGHVAGDRALVHFVTTVRATLRPTDLTARSGGEEFGVLLPALTVGEGVEAVQRLQRELARRPFLFEQERLVLTFSAGVAGWQAGDSLEQLMQRADVALYEAKRTGKNRVCAAAPG